MNDDELLVRNFESHREHLRSVALRMLGSSHEADDAVEVYRRFRVPEVWICDENQLQFSCSSRTADTFPPSGAMPSIS